MFLGDSSGRQASSITTGRHRHRHRPLDISNTPVISTKIYYALLDEMRSSFVPTFERLCVRVFLACFLFWSLACFADSFVRFVSVSTRNVWMSGYFGCVQWTTNTRSTSCTDTQRQAVDILYRGRIFRESNAIHTLSMFQCYMVAISASLACCHHTHVTHINKPAPTTKSKPNTHRFLFFFFFIYLRVVCRCCGCLLFVCC